MVNERFGRLVVLSLSDESTPKRKKWNCLCDCGNEKVVRQDHLKYGVTSSCGCLHKERSRAANRNPNRFEIKNDHVVVYANNTGSEFYVDLDDWPKVSQHGWYEGKQGYLLSRIDGRLTRLHRLIMNADSDIQVDHKDRNTSNNRKSNLRFATNAQNQMNKLPGDRNKSGKRGVFWREDRQKWLVRVSHTHIGMYSDFDEAVAAREKAEKEMYGEFVPDA